MWELKREVGRKIIGRTLMRIVGIVEKGLLMREQG